MNLYLRVSLFVWAFIWGLGVFIVVPAGRMRTRDRVTRKHFRAASLSSKKDVLLAEAAFTTHLTRSVPANAGWVHHLQG